MEELVNRVRNIINICWDSFSAKVGNGIIAINKEASMQLEFACFLKQSLGLAIYNLDESVEIELETSLHLDIGFKECDILIKFCKGEETYFIPIELKCFKEFQPNGNPTNGYTQFRNKVYNDLSLLESYSQLEGCLKGISFTITDFEGLVNRNTFWGDNTCNGTNIKNGIVSNVNYEQEEQTLLTGNYNFNWESLGYWHFLKLEDIG